MAQKLHFRLLIRQRKQFVDTGAHSLSAISSGREGMLTAAEK